MVVITTVPQNIIMQQAKQMGSMLVEVGQSVSWPFILTETQSMNSF